MTISKIKRTTSIGNLLRDSNSYLSYLFKQAHKLEKLNRIFKKTIDSDLAKHCNIAKFDGITLVLIADDANWATHLRYTIPDLLKTLRVQPEFHDLNKIRYRINKQHQQKEEPKEIAQKKQTLPQNAAKLKKYANNISNQKTK